MNLIKDITYSNSISRMANISLPFLQLYRPTNVAVSVFSGFAKIWEISQETKKEWDDNKWHMIFDKSSRILFRSTCVALNIFFPKAAIVLSGSKSIAEDILDITLNIYNQEVKNVSLGVLKIGHTVFHLASVVKPTPTILLISLSAQGALEFYQASIEYSKKARLAEAIANLLLGTIRIYFAYPHACKVKRDLFGKIATDEDLKLVMKEISLLQEKYPERLIDFDRALSKHNLSGTVRANSVFGELPDQEYIEGSHTLLESRKIERIKFENISFQGEKIKNTFMKEVLFKNVTFKDMRFKKCIFLDVKFIHSTFSNTEFFRTLYDNVTFFKCDLSFSHFVFSNLKRTTFAHSELKETSFLGSRVTKSNFVDSKLNDCFLFSTEQQFSFLRGKKIQSDRPVIGLLWNYKNPGGFAIKSSKILREDFGVIPLLIDYNMAPRLSLEDYMEIFVQKEILLNQSIEESKLSSENSESFMMRLLRERKQTQGINYIYDYAEKILAPVDALILPGGEDINQTFTSLSVPIERGGERIIFESCCIKIASESKIPLLGICRGAQAVSTYFGATLKNVKPQSGFHDYKIKNPSLDPDVQLIQNMVGQTFTAFSAHHQAVVIESIEDNPYLKVIVKTANIPKILSCNKDNWKGILTQIHPEIYITELGLIYDEIIQNRNIFTHLILEAHRKKLKEKNPDLVAIPDFLERRIALYAYEYFNKGENFIHSRNLADPEDGLKPLKGNFKKIKKKKL